MRVDEGGKTRAANGIEIPEWIKIVTVHHGNVVKMMAEYRPESGRYEATSVCVERGDGPEVTGEQLRLIPVAQILRDAVKSVLKQVMLQWPRPTGRPRPCDETFAMVANIYTIALLVGESPTQAVADTLGINRSTAASWATRARDRGLLTVRDSRGTRKE